MDSFFKEAILSFKTSGTIRPSSKYLIHACLKDIDFERAENIIEFGAGNGCITSEIISRKRKGANLYSFELMKNSTTIVKRGFITKMDSILYMAPSSNLIKYLNLKK